MSRSQNIPKASGCPSSFHLSKLPESSTPSRRGTKPSTIYTSEYKHENIMSDIQFRPAKTVSRYYRDRLAYMTTEIDRLGAIVQGNPT